MSRRGKRTCPLDLKLGHNNWLRQVKVGRALGQASVTQWGWFAAVPLQGCLALTASNSESDLCFLRKASSDFDLGVCEFLNSELLVATVLLPAFASCVCGLAGHPQQALFKHFGAEQSRNCHGAQCWENKKTLPPDHPRALMLFLLVSCHKFICAHHLAFPASAQVLFTPATQAARQAACTIVEALATIPSRKQQVLDLLTRYSCAATPGSSTSVWLQFPSGSLPSCSFSHTSPL